MNISPWTAAADWIEEQAERLIPAAILLLIVPWVWFETGSAGIAAIACLLLFFPVGIVVMLGLGALLVLFWIMGAMHQALR